MRSINLCYKRKKKNRQKRSPGRNMLVNVCLPTLHAGGSLSDPSDLASDHQASLAALAGLCIFLSNSQPTRLSRTRQGGPVVTLRGHQLLPAPQGCRASFPANHTRKREWET